jgi:hypothetical protein
MIDTDSLRGKIYPFVSELNDPWKHVDEIMQLFATEQAKLLDRIEREVIGNNQNDSQPNTPNALKSIAQTRIQFNNELRDSQRQALATLFNKTDSHISDSGDKQEDELFNKEKS